MKKYNITNDMQGGIKAVESNTGHWMLAGEVERMLEDMEPRLGGKRIDIVKKPTKGNDNGN